MRLQYKLKVAHATTRATILGQGRDPAPAYDPYLHLALRVVQKAAMDKDMRFFNDQSDDSAYRFWMDYIKACLPGALPGEVLPIPQNGKTVKYIPQMRERTVK